MEIRTDIPLPQPRKDKSGMVKTFRAMPIGGSVSISQRLYKGCYRCAQLANIKITSAAEGDQIRVWRIA